MPTQTAIIQILTRAKLNVLERQERTDECLALCLRMGEHLRYALKLLELARLPESLPHALKYFHDASEALTFAQRLVIKASIKQAESLIAPTKSNLYPHAADWLRRAKAAHAQLGHTDKWQKYLLQLKEQYRLRPALMTQLTKL